MAGEAYLVIICVSFGVALGVLIACLIFFGIRRYKKHAHPRRSANEPSSTTLPIRTNGLGTSTELSASLTGSISIPTQGSDNLQRKSHFTWWNHQNKDPIAPASGILKYSYKEIQKATQNFTNKLGQGSFGTVHKATLPTGEVVAVKMLAPNSRQGEKEFQTEAVPPVIHRDLKSANILLDHSMRAKVADFGLSKEEAFDDRNSGLKGTYGYMDPVYISTSKFTTKSDIYSFGIIIFELITAIQAHENLMEYINLAAMDYDGIDGILDKQLVGKCNLEEVRQLAKIAHKCLQKSPNKRPSINEVSQGILMIKQRRLVKEDTMSFASSNFSRAVSRVEDQQVELSRIVTINQRESR